MLVGGAKPVVNVLRYADDNKNPRDRELVLPEPQIVVILPLKGIGQLSTFAIQGLGAFQLNVELGASVPEGGVAPKA